MNKIKIIDRNVVDCDDNVIYTLLKYDEEVTNNFTSFVDEYNTIEDRIQKLYFIHKTASKLIPDNIVYVELFINSFNTPTLTSSELKTIMIITKPFKDKCKDRSKLVNTYQALKKSVS